MEPESVRLTIVTSSGVTASCRVSADRVRIGREPACDVRVDDGEVSRFHAELVREGHGWTLRDCGSRNGTRRNGRTIAGAEELRPGDQIGLGDTTIVFADEEADVARSHTTRIKPREGDVDAVRSGLGLVGSSPAIRTLIDTVRRVAAASCPVLVLGENGAGKELVARLVHELSPRSRAPFVVVNCPALPGALVEAELFGVERGVATGVEARPGKFEAADSGTLLLDEVGDLDAAAQAKLLRVLETKTLDRVGGRSPVTNDVRVVAATNHDLAADVAAGTFRRDLYHRLDGVTLRVPPLRERREDVPALVRHFVARSSRPSVSFSPGALGRLAAYEFPGNVRELAHLVERVCLLSDGAHIETEELERFVPRDGAGSGAIDVYRRVVDGCATFWEAVADPFLRRELPREQVERIVDAARAATDGSYRGAARLLRVDGEYKRLLNFLNHHRIGKRSRGDGGQ